MLTDAQWQHIAPLLPASEGRQAARFAIIAESWKALSTRYRTGVAWRDLPVRFGPWQTVWKRHKRFSGDETGKTS